MRHFHNTYIGSDLVIFHLESQYNIMEFVPPEIFMHLAIGLIPNLASGRCEQRRNRRFRSFFGTRIDTCVDLCFLCYDDFDNLTMPVYLLWTLMFLKQYSTEEVNAARAGVHEDTFRDCVWRVLTVISNVEFVSVIHQYVTSALTIF